MKRLMHSPHEPRRLPQITVLLWPGAVRSVLPLLQLKAQHDWVAAFVLVIIKIPITNSMILISEGVQLPRDDHPSRAVRVIEYYAHALIEAIPPTSKIFVRHNNMLIPSVNHLTHIMEFVGGVGLRLIGVA